MKLKPLNLLFAAALTGAAVWWYVKPVDASDLKDAQGRWWPYAPKGVRVQLGGTYFGGDDKWWLIFRSSGSQGFSSYEEMYAAASVMPPSQAW
jgi:hypothetical protein